MFRPIASALLLLLPACRGDDEHAKPIDGTYKLEGTSVSYEDNFYAENGARVSDCAALSWPTRSPAESRIQLTTSGSATRIEFEGACTMTGTMRENVLIARDADCVLPSGSWGEQIGIESIQYELFELDFSTSLLRMRSRMVQRRADDQVDHRCVNYDYSVEGPSGLLARNTGPRTIWHYDAGEFTATEEMPLGSTECGRVVRSGGEASGRIREYDDGTFFLEGFDCRIETRSGEELVKCPEQPDRLEELPEMFVREFTLDEGVLSLHGEMRKADFRYCFDLEAPVERMPNTEK